MALGKLCARHGVQPGRGPCEECARAKWRADGAERRTRDKAAGGSVYRDPRWKQIRLKVLNRDNFTCQYGWAGCLVKANIAAHKEPFSDIYDPRAFDEDNLIASCAPCNAREQAMRLSHHAVDL